MKGGSAAVSGESGPLSARARISPALMAFHSSSSMTSSRRYTSVTLAASRLHGGASSLGPSSPPSWWSWPASLRASEACDRLFLRRFMVSSPVFSRSCPLRSLCVFCTRLLPKDPTSASRASSLLRDWRPPTLLIALTCLFNPITLVEGLHGSAIVSVDDSGSKTPMTYLNNEPLLSSSFPSNSRTSEVARMLLKLYFAPAFPGMHVHDSERSLSACKLSKGGGASWKDTINDPVESMLSFVTTTSSWFSADECSL
mmetsp:Transcript_57611/g.151630  ORF Transcript_57611/g.151630 Transcript_57611/m.151630 type:complete len:256 (-) Transcript_57611:29-796(-)